MCFVFGIFVFKMAQNLDLLSLEDEECSQMFITQESHGNVENLMDKSGENSDDNLFLGMFEDDFSSPCVSLMDNNLPVYSDISDDEVFEKKQPEPDPKM